MPDTGEKGELRPRVNAREAEEEVELMKLLEKTSTSARLETQRAEVEKKKRTMDRRESGRQR